MKYIDVEAYAKVNLSLDVLYKRKDNYHEINTIMQQTSLRDIVTIETTNDKHLKIESNKEGLPLDSTNLAYKAWEQIQIKTGIKRGAKIKLYKQIPIAAGLAGGSSNAAATLIGLNKLWKLNLSDRELMDIGLSIGADVPYCLMGGTAHAEGIGEILTRLKSFKDKYMILINPGIQISTAYVYNQLKPHESKRIDMKEIIGFIEKDDLIGLGKNMKNIMEEVVIAKYPIIGEIKREIMECGAIGSLMSGSGSTVFGLFDDLERLDHCKKKLNHRGRVLKCQTL